MNDVSTTDRGDDDWRQSIYDQLHVIADRALAREAPGHSLQPTLLVNDAYLRLMQQQNLRASDRPQFMAAGANIIRRLLVDYARARKSKKRGGSEGRGAALSVSIAAQDDDLDLLELHESLEALSVVSKRAADVVELKFFGGLSGEEIAHQLDISLRTVNNDWKFAKAWLYKEMSRRSED